MYRACDDACIPMPLARWLQSEELRPMQGAGKGNRGLAKGGARGAKREQNGCQLAKASGSDAPTCAAGFRPLMLSRL